MYTSLDIPLIVFDVDGTLHYTPAISDGALEDSFNAFMQTHDPIDNGMAEADRTACIGMTVEEFSECFLAGMSGANREKIIDMILSAEVKALDAGKGKLYPEVLETLDELRKRGYLLAVFSNAMVSYFNAVLDNLRLRDRFEFHICHDEDPTLGKDGMLRLIKDKLKVDKAAIVGDRYHDMLAATLTGDIGIGAGYGFGADCEMQLGKHVLENFSDILDIFR